ncbi:MAG: hypothetical protein OJF48_001750 [Afipia sp.]|nr:MAG: hypothetical protein OJF48_001750 [Afipia sp.]
MPAIGGCLSDEDRIVIPQDALDRIFDGIICSALSADLSEDQADMGQPIMGAMGEGTAQNGLSTSK